MPTLHGHPVALWFLKGPELGTSVPTVDTVSVSGFMGSGTWTRGSQSRGGRRMQVPVVTMPDRLASRIFGVLEATGSC